MSEKWDGVMTREVYLSSATVFWEDLGISAKRDLIIEERLFDRWYIVADWLDEHIKGPWQSHHKGVWFFDPKDAMLFKLVWAGQML